MSEYDELVRALLVERFRPPGGLQGSRSTTPKQLARALANERRAARTAGALRSRTRAAAAATQPGSTS